MYINIYIYMYTSKYMSILSLLVFFLFLSFRRVLNVIYSFLGNSPAPEF